MINDFSYQSLILILSHLHWSNIGYIECIHCLSSDEDDDDDDDNDHHNDDDDDCDDDVNEDQDGDDEVFQVCRLTRCS